MGGEGELQIGRMVVQEAPVLEEAVVSKVTVEEAVGVQQAKVGPKHVHSGGPHQASGASGEEVTTFLHHRSPQSPLSLMDLMTLGKQHFVLHVLMYLPCLCCSYCF